MAFRSMIDLGRFRSFRENILGKLKGQIRSIALKKDIVIPANGIVNTLTAWAAGIIIRLKFGISHIPIRMKILFLFLISPSSAEVDRCFESSY